MRNLVLLAAGLMLFTSGSVTAQTTMISSTPLSSSNQVCPKCGKIHAPQISGQATQPPTQGVQMTNFAAPVAQTSAMRASGGVMNVLSSLNAQRSRQGIGTLRYDASLQAVAERRAQSMASMSLKSHPPGSFSPGTHEGVGWSSSYSPSGVSACFTSDTRMQYAGAAMATGRDGVYFAVVYR